MERGSIKAVQKEEMMEEKNTSWKQESLKKGEREGKGSPIPKIRKWKTGDWLCDYLYSPTLLTSKYSQGPRLWSRDQKKPPDTECNEEGAKTQQDRHTMVCQSKSKIVKRGLKFSLNVEQIWRKQAPLQFHLKSGWHSECWRRKSWIVLIAQSLILVEGWDT